MAEVAWENDVWREVQRKTHDALLDPQIGDHFHEMAAFHVFVVHRWGQYVITMEANPPCTLPRDGVVKMQTVAELRKRFSSGTKPEQYWIELIERNINVEGWREAAKSQ